MPVNKVTFGGRTLIDISDTIIDESRLPLGSAVYNAQGVRIQGSAVVYDVYRDTTANWAQKTSFVPKAGDIIIYTDRSQIEVDGQLVDVPAFKIGDGNAYVVDLPFTDAANVQEMINHINDQNVHVTQQEKQFWNNKLNYNMSGENLTLNRM